MSRPGFTLSATVEKGKLTLDNERRYRELLKRLRDGRYTIVIERETKGRSRQANRYLWGCCYALLSEHTGYTPDELHAHFKREFLGVQTKRILLQDEAGEVKQESEIPVEPTTTTLDTQAFTVFIENVRRVAAEIGCVIPDPDPEHMFNAA